MKITILAFFIMVSFSNAALAERCRDGEQPWLVYGQSSVPSNASINNPSTNSDGVIGASSLPFTVPSGKTLVITSYGIEGYDAKGIAVLFPFIGQSSQPPFDGGAFMSAGADSGSNMLYGAYNVLSGSVVNVRIINGTDYGGTAGAVFGWAVHGCLK